MLSDIDIQQIKEKGIELAEVETQLKNFNNGFPCLNVIKAATTTSGIKSLNKEEIEEVIKKYETEKDKYSITKFVPASGAATRMFSALLNFMKNYTGTEEEYLKLISDRCFTSNYYLYERMESFAFFEDLVEVIKKNGENYEEIVHKKDYTAILEALLNEEGLNYKNLPKGLIKFHKYEDSVRTPLEEHIIEGFEYALSNNTVNIHFTISPNHLDLFKKHATEARIKYEKELKIKINISFSIQDPKTDIIAVNSRNNPLKDNNKNLIFRPGGHGAILQNLNDLDYDIIFIKNIDNVVPDRLRADTVKYKKALAGVLLKYQSKINTYVKYLEVEKKPATSNLKEIRKFIEKELCVLPPKSIYRYSKRDKIKYYLKKLKRPLRVCGMVKNEGEPGGGPFWAKNADGSVSLQIVEGAQFDKKKKKQLKVFNEATHFNPVDLVCGVKDLNGNKYDLMNLRDNKTGIITKKSKDGVSLKAQELPGLWNGSMSDWNTIFVEVPVSTFNPVKIINDLLRNEHMAVETVLHEQTHEV
ncbi:MAG: DUF4301 family protein [Chlorobi bacterium]|nr:DUF4301 family protein [Chlorobiota bacterium]